MTIDTNTGASQSELISYLLRTVEAQNRLIESQNTEINSFNISNSFHTMRFTELLDEWLKQRKPFIQANTYYTYLKEYQNHLLPYFSENNSSLNDITQFDIEEFYSTKLLQGLSPNTVIRLHAFIFSAFKYAEAKDYLTKNPMRQVKRPKAVTFIPNVLDAELLKQLFIDTRNLKIYPAIIIAATLGLRRSEIAGLTWDSINLTTGYITIRQKTIKVAFSEHDLKQLKTQTSYRCLKLPNMTLQFLKRLKSKQDKLKKYVQIKFCLKISNMCA